MNKLLADITVGGDVIKDPLMGPGGQKIGTIGDLVNILTSFLYPIAGVLLFLYLAWGGFDFLLSQGDKEKVGSAKGKITAALVGFLLLMFSYIFVRIIVEVFGLSSAKNIF